MQTDGYTGWTVDVFQNTVQNSADATQLGETITGTGTGTLSMQPYALVNNTFVPTTSGIYYFAVRVNQPSGSPFYVAFDDFSLDLTPPCVAPTVTAATNVTTSTATINWLASSTVAANGYEYFVTTSNESPDANTVPTGSVVAGVTSIDLTDLDVSTIYKYYVKAICSDSDSSVWSQAGTFTTLCDVASLPYTINFESATVPALPICTSNQNVGTGNNWITANNPGSGFTNKTLRYTYNSTNPANAWFYTNRVSLVAGTQYTISYKFGTNSTTYVEKFKIAFGDTAVNTSMTNEIIDHPSVMGNSPQTNTATFSPTVSGVYYIGFNVYSATNQNALFIDDIVIQEALGNANFENNSFKAYPNPVKNDLTIRYTENISSATIYNILGQELFVKNINNTEGQIDMSNLAAGTYLVKVKSGEKVETIKVIKE
ncbi:MAG: T9SS type A sorting domain-containing protein [Flavobacterium sp.]|nr:MAG: T9SS type A sorting domain-containing protein [Flavobacterium sp.]